MLDPALVKDRLSDVEARLNLRGTDLSKELAELAKIEAERRRLIPAVENLKREQNASSEAVARAKKEGRDPSAIFAENKARGARIKELEAGLTEVESRRDTLLLRLPNVPHESVPVGKASADNAEIKRWGSPPSFGFEPKPHWEVGQALGILDFDRSHGPDSWVSYRRFHHQYQPDELAFEQGGLTADEQGKLKALGHALKEVPWRYGDMHAVMWDRRSGFVFAASDPRGEGKATVFSPAPQ